MIALAIQEGIGSLPAIRSSVETLATEKGITIKALHAPRLLALWDRPQFVWKVDPDSIHTSALLKALAAMPACRRIGLLQVPSERMALHPPQMLERIERSLSELQDDQEQEPIVSNPCLVHWSNS